MEKYKIIRSEKTKTGIRLEVDYGRTTEEVRFKVIRGGLNWPTNESDAILSLVGEALFDPLYSAEVPFRELIAEYSFSGLSMEEGFAVIRDAASQYFVQGIYTDGGEVAGDFWSAYYDFRKQHNARCGQLHAAPYLNNFIFGLALIQDGLKNNVLDVPKHSRAYDELKRISKPDLLMAPEIKFPATNALRFVVGSYRADPPRQPTVHPKPRRMSAPVGWMGH